MAIITLLSDFGLKDPYVAEMKAVIHSIHPEARIVDISHEIGKFNIRMGAFVLASATPYFPKGTIHVAVVDQGWEPKDAPYWRRLNAPSTWDLTTASSCSRLKKKE